MGVVDIEIVMDEELLSRVKAAAERSASGDVSAWLSEAASASLRRDEARRVLDEPLAEPES